MREVIGLFAYNRSLITDELVQMRYEASLNPPVRDSWAAMFPHPQQRWVDDLALSGAELNAVSQPVLLVHGDRDDLIPPQALFEATQGLAALDVPAEWHLSPGIGHGIDGEGLRHGGEFLARRWGGLRAGR